MSRSPFRAPGPHYFFIRRKKEGRGEKRGSTWRLFPEYPNGGERERGRCAKLKKKKTVFSAER